MHRKLADRNVTALTRARAMAHALSTTAAIAAIHGADLNLPAANLCIRIPRHALPHDTSITVEAHPELHGFTVTCSPALSGPLALPAIVEQGLESAPDNGAGLVLVEVDTIGASAQAKGFTRLSLLADGTAVGRLSHFSGYLVATGLQEGEPCDPADGDPNCVWVD